MTAADPPPSEPSAPIAVELLGRFRVSVAGVAVPEAAWPSRRACELVQLLALADSQRLPREQAIDALWPRLDPQAGSANLRKAAHHARQALGLPEAVALRGGQVILLAAARATTDAARFEQAADAALATGDPTACAAAAARYGGELLPEARYADWTEAPRDRLHRKHLALLRASGQFERLAQADPTDEAAHRELMRAALAAGSRPAAIRWYGRLRSALEQSLGVLPGRETEALYERCLAGLGTPGPAFVGRQMELARGTAAMRGAADRRGGGLVVRGAAGVGKTAFCGRLGRLAQDEGWSVVTVEASEAGRPYSVVAAAADRLILADRGVLARIGEHARAVLARITALAAPAPALPGPLGRQQVLGAMRRLLLAAAGSGAVMVVADDVHRLDEASAELLLHMAASGHPVFVVLAYRPEAARRDLERGVARLARGGGLVVLDLGPLDRDDTASLARDAASRPLDAAIVDRIVARSEGNPFAALELARVAGEQPAARLPATARDAIAQRFCDVDDGTVQLLERLALCTDDADTTTVMALTATDEPRAFELLDRALSAGVLVVSDSRYRFRHDLVRQALVERIPPHQALVIHRDAAGRLALLDAPPARIARHWLAGGRPDAAVPLLMAAAQEAVRLAAFPDALGLLDALLAHAPGHADALGLRAEALDATGDPRTLAAYDAAAAAARAAGDPAAHDLRAKRALAQLKMGDATGALRSVEGTEPVTVDGRLAQALTFSGAAALGFGDPAQGTAKAAECRRLALQSGDTAALVIASWAQAAAAHARGELHDSVWADLRDTHDLPHLAIRVFDGHLCITQRFLYGARPYRDVIAFADALAAEARRIGAARGHAFAVTLRGEARLLSGQLDAAEEDLTAGGHLHRAILGATGEALSLQRRAELAAYRGRFEQAHRLLDEALDLARQTDIGFHLLDRIYGTRIAIARDPEAALAAVEDAAEAVRGPLETCPGCRITFAIPAVIAAARARELELATKHEHAADYLANVVMRLPAWHAALGEARAHIALATGDRAEAAARFAAAADGFGAAGHPLDRQRCADGAARAGQRA
jgi:DNA-binding SARP family transcriptional activator